MMIAHQLVFISILCFVIYCSSYHKEDPFHYAVGSTKRYENYKYATLNEKLAESLDATCGVYNNEHMSISPYVSVKILHPSVQLVNFWEKIPPPATLIDKEICTESPKFFNRKGCSKGVALHPDSPRCHREKTRAVCNALQFEHPLVLNETIASRHVSPSMLISTAPFIITAKNGIVARCGGVAMPCGVLHTKTGCGAIRDEEAREMYQSCFVNTTNPICNLLPRHKKLFVLSYKYDSAIGHFLTEVLPRVIYHIDFLKDEDVLIHYGCDKKYQRFSPPMQFLEWLGFNHTKFVQGDVFSEEIFVPRDGACQDALWNRWEITKLRHYFLKKVGLSQRIGWTSADTFAWKDEIPVVVVMQRSGSKFSANRGDVTRLWSDQLFESVLTMMRIAFPSRLIVPYSDRNTTMMRCISCQVELFSKTSVLVGMHGAGLSNMVFMPPESVVVEITAQNDGRMLPGSGPFSRLAMATGINHYIHYLKSGTKSFTKKEGINFSVESLVDSVHASIEKIEKKRSGITNNL